ncbi:cob(I)yrinic acid a,c-diamide adenosyltransferase [Jeotgalibaca caeni]|uniref:cob(I)yrinic acid a,c-diamide adenosyltransferase n=1 Tax=Jeotgalibaca caeni TaxID=3028623 RepID=UPI00237D9CDF|nr:cob(I)yrinic acid a,c-diamide adenosyltransferase [Jeotgalibaca caeni]MDE1547610.1 cob(I)yrinic acid a,c-diamide adenosyltransferase [Jeotgalibaca caeni]
MQLYTRTGDKGKTRIIGNSVVSKSDVRVEAYGTIDELNSLIGIVASLSSVSNELTEELQLIQQYLFDCGTDTSMPHDESKYRTKATYITWLEKRIDYYSDLPPKIQSFILPGGSYAASQVHFARTVARRAERRVVAFQETTESNIYVLQFLNRLSDYLFALARVLNFEEKHEETFYERSGKVFR